MFATIAKVDLSRSVVDQMREAILLGRLRPGDALPPERELVADFGVNRATVREGLSRLEQLGLIERRQGARGVVLDYRRTGSVELLSTLARLDVDDAWASIVDTTGIIYEGMVERAAQRATTVDVIDLRQLANAVEHAAAAGEPGPLLEADRAFQARLAATTRSVGLELMVATFYRSFASAAAPDGRVWRTFAELLLGSYRRGRLPHPRLVDAIAAGDPDTGRALVRRIIDSWPRRTHAGPTTTHRHDRA